jgi:hypothetical protein
LDECVRGLHRLGAIGWRWAFRMQSAAAEAAYKRGGHTYPSVQRLRNTEHGYLHCGSAIASVSDFGISVLFIECCK